MGVAVAEACCAGTLLTLLECLRGTCCEDAREPARDAPRDVSRITGVIARGASYRKVPRRANKQVKGADGLRVGAGSCEDSPGGRVSNRGSDPRESCRTRSSQGELTVQGVGEGIFPRVGADNGVCTTRGSRPLA